MKRVLEATRGKPLFALFLALLPGILQAGSIFVAKYESQAEVKIFAVKYESQADLCVRWVRHESQARGRDELWHAVKFESQADVKVFFVPYESQADIRVHFVRHESQAGWRAPSPFQGRLGAESL